MGKLLNVDTYAQYMSAQNELLEVIADATTTDEEIEEIVSNLENKVDKETGKGLSDNNYDNSAKAKVDAIPSNPKYTDTIYDDTEITENISTLSEDLANKAEVFRIIYGQTTLAEIEQAIADSKLLYCSRGDFLYQYAGYDANYYVFTSALAKISNNIKSLSISRTTGSWSAYDAGFQDAANRVNSIEGYETITYKYPSTKAVYGFLCSDTPMDTATQNKALARLGAEPKKGEWVLKGTLSGNADDRGNIDSGVNVDLSGCTEFYIISKSDTVSTNTHALQCNLGSLVVDCFSASRKGHYAKFEDSDIGFDCVLAKQSSSASSVALPYNALGYCYTNGNKIREITTIKFGNPSYITSCNIEIYAR